jgi:hypothetical protein
LIESRKRTAHELQFFTMHADLYLLKNSYIKSK